MGHAREPENEGRPPANDQSYNGSMTWKNIDLFRMEARFFSDELRGVVLPVFITGVERLEEWEKQHRKELDAKLAEAKGDAEISYAFGEADFEKWRNMQRAQVVGSAALHSLYLALKLKLRELARWFDKSHARQAGGYTGNSELQKLATEFLERFGIDFTKAPVGFNNIEELALARNASIHSDLREYLGKVRNPRFVRKDEFFVDIKPFEEIVGQVEEFVEWVVSELAKLRK
jgi:hypothetical protein